MALDTRSKRASSVGLLLAFVLAAPLADGTFSQGDRQHLAATYSGIEAAGSEAAVESATATRRPSYARAQEHRQRSNRFVRSRDEEGWTR